MDPVFHFIYLETKVCRANRNHRNGTNQIALLPVLVNGNATGDLLRSKMQKFTASAPEISFAILTCKLCATGRTTAQRREMTRLIAPMVVKSLV
jgi:hypothetical protein